MNGSLLASGKQDWATPWPLFEQIAAVWGPFDRDVCATPETAKVDRYYTPTQDGLTQAWRGVVYCNPPYRDAAKWIAKAAAEVANGHARRVVLLLAARPDTRAWHTHILDKPGVTVQFLRGRIRFEGAAHPAPFPSAVVVMQPVIGQSLPPSTGGSR